jgi:RalA-binding protein 1
LISRKGITELSHHIAILPSPSCVNRLISNANVNKMTTRNVGIVFSPTLGIRAGLFSLMLEFNRAFDVNDDAYAYEAESAAITSV